MGAGATVIAATAAAFHAGLLVTAFGFGFRHGIDWDHVAALTDITAAQESTPQSLRLATMYALDHALVVFVLGFGAIVLAEHLPAGIDHAMERVVGVTLLALGLYVIVSLVRHGREFRMRSRWMLVFAGARRLARWVRHGRAAGAVVMIEHDHDHDPAHHSPGAGDHHGPVPAVAATAEPEMAGDRVRVMSAHRHRHRHIGALPEDPFPSYGRATAFGVGMLHGIGAETPTQVVIFATAAGAGGRVAGVLVLVAFLAGLLTSNSVVALAATFGFIGASKRFAVYAAVSMVTAVFSLAIGSLFVFGHGAALPALFGG